MSAPEHPPAPGRALDPMGETMWQMKLLGRDVRVWVGLPVAAATCLLGLVPAASAAPAPTELQLAGPTKPVAAGGKARLVATLTSAGKPLAGKSVSFFTGATELGKATTDSKGRAKRNVKLTASTSFAARFTPAGADATAYAASESPAVTLAPAGRATVHIDSSLRAGPRAVGIPHEPVRISGSVTPFVAGASVEISVVRGQRRVLHEARRLTASRSGRGKFALWIGPSRRGVYRVTVRQAGAAGDSARLYVVRPSAHSGSQGLGVRALQHRLKQLGYLTAVNGHYDSSTGRAVLAFRKVNGFGRLTSASTKVFKRLARGGGAFKLRYPKAGKHAEFDWSRQVLVLANHGRAQIIVHTSSGKPSTPTVMGHFRFYSKSPGTNSHGMYYSSYFHGGYAVHGYPSVPTYPASHGCIRIPNASAKRVYAWIGLGNDIWTYR